MASTAMVVAGVVAVVHMACGHPAACLPPQQAACIMYTPPADQLPAPAQPYGGPVPAAFLPAPQSAN
jgi:hypothetical protein